MEEFYPNKNHSGSIGKKNRIWNLGYFDRIVLPEISAPSGNPDADHGWLYVKDNGGTSALYFEDDGGSVTQIATSPTAFDDIGDPDAAGTIAFTTYAQTLTSTKTDGDMITISGLGNFGDVSVVRIESKTGNPTDGTVLEVVSHDANVDPLVVSALNKASALIVGQDGNVSMSDNLTVTGTSTLTGVATAKAGVVLGAASTKIMSVAVTLTSAQVKALRATPQTIIAAQGAGTMIELLGASFFLNYGSNAFTESSDDLQLQYNSAVAASSTLTSNGFITATADTIAKVTPAAIAGAAVTNFINKAITLKNTGDGEIAGNAANDSTLTVVVTYVVHASGF